MLARDLVTRRVKDNDTAADIIKQIYSAAESNPVENVERGARVTGSLVFMCAVLVHRLATETAQTSDDVLDAVYEAIGLSTF